jgi:malate dehydrogenase (oxaloacetate-decarboxylating)(NADP+)
MSQLYEDALKYHAKDRKGKIEVIPSKVISTQHDLSLAYSPGVAAPCIEIAKDPNKIFDYTAKGNLVAVISNGTAVLGLGSIGPLAAKPVMEGKAVLFKKFADIDVFDLELNVSNPDVFIQTCVALEPTFGGINLEDIKAPECFYIEEALQQKLNIPVFHDDQHGTAVISGAAFLNAIEITQKDITKVKVVFCGSGAAAIACAKLYLTLGVKKENIFMADSKGLIYEGRTEGMNTYKQFFAQKTDKRTIAEALEGADAFIGVSVKNSIQPDMLIKMNHQPIIFAMANPDPEILPEKVFEIRPDAIMATGRSDYPNQVNNVLGFPFIFRGALDVMATQINDAMKLAAVHALATLAKQDIPESVKRAYAGQNFKFGKNYLIPKPFDQRALLWVSPAVAQAAMDSGVARKMINIKEYTERLESILGSTYTIMRGIKNQLKDYNKPTIVFPEGSHPTILKACKMIIDEGIAQPILLGDTDLIKKNMEQFDLAHCLQSVLCINPKNHKNLPLYAETFLQKRARKGVSPKTALSKLTDVNYFGAMMVEKGHADGLISGIAQTYASTLRPGLEIIGAKKNSRLAGIFLIFIRKKPYFFADTTVNIDPSTEDIVQITLDTARFVSSFTGQEPRIALISFSNFGSTKHPFSQKASKAVNILHTQYPELIVDGEMQLDTALNPIISENHFSFNKVPGNANVLIFPNLESANIAYKLMTQTGTTECIGPILVGMQKPIFVLQQDADILDVVHMATIAARQIHTNN